MEVLMNKKNGAANNKKQEKTVAHKPWELEIQTEGLDEGHGPSKSAKAESAKSENKDEKKKDAECGCKYF